MKLVDFLICEDIRQEMGGKLSAMGIFGDTITLGVPKDAASQFAFRLAAHIRLEAEPNDPTAMSFQFKIFVDGVEIAGIVGLAARVESGLESSLLTLPLVIPAVPITSSGTMHFSLRLTQENDVEFFSQSLRPIKLVVERVK